MNTELIRFTFTEIDGIEYFTVKPRGVMTDDQLDDYAISLGENPEWHVIPRHAVIWMPVPAPVGFPAKQIWDTFKAQKDAEETEGSTALNDENMPIMPSLRREWAFIISQTIEGYVTYLKKQPIVVEASKSIH